jgi:predicted nucleic acid-binding protein
MIVVADTSPLNYLILIEEADVLRKLYGRILIPPAVQVELLQPGAPAAVMAWMQKAARLA